MDEELRERFFDLFALLLPSRFLVPLLLRPESLRLESRLDFPIQVGSKAPNWGQEIGKMRGAKYLQNWNTDISATHRVAKEQKIAD